MFRGAVVQPFLRRATSCTTGARLTSAKGSEMSDFNPPTPPPVGPPGTPGAAPVPLSDAETRQWAGFAHLGGILWFLPSLIIWPVSYTHLRAHETRHDLVCRLLLEKKK